MKLQQTNQGFKSNFPTTGSGFQMKASAKLFQILSDGIYSDKQLATIRELSCNAYDAHVAAGKKNVPFRVYLPSRLDATFRVEDDGTGIDPNKMVEIYCSYGNSTKTNDNEAIGALGLGSKSPFAYTKSQYMIKNRFNGVEYVYFARLDKAGEPEIILIDEERTTKPNGITVEFAVKLEDVQSFTDRAGAFFKYWEHPPIFVGRDTNDVIRTKVIKTLEGNGWFLEKRVDGYGRTVPGTAVSIQGNVPYPIVASSIPNLPHHLEQIANNSFVITFDMGSLNFQSSREQLSYDEMTCANIIERLEEVHDEMSKQFIAKVMKKGMTQVEFVKNFHQSFREFRAAFYSHADDDAIMQMLIAKSLDDTLRYDGYDFVVKDLLTLDFETTVDGHSDFGIYRPDYRSRAKSSVALNLLTQVSLSFNRDLSLVGADRGGQTRLAGRTYTTKHTAEFDWKHLQVRKPRGVNNFNELIALRENDRLLIDARTTTRFKRDITADNVVFYLNDCGQTGNDRFKAAYKNLSTKDQKFYVTFDPKLADLKQVRTNLNEIIKNGLHGAQVILVSSLGDHRVVKAKLPTVRGMIKLRTKTVVFTTDMHKIALSGTSQFKINDVAVGNITEESVSVASLKGVLVPYVIKRRSPTDLYTKVGGHQKTNFFQHLTLGLAYTLGMVTESVLVDQPGGNKSLKIYALTEGQFDWLQKRKVNLVPAMDMVHPNVVAMLERDKFTDNVKSAKTLAEVQLLSELVGRMSPGQKQHLRAQTSLLANRVNEYIDVVSGKMIVDFAKASLLDMVVPNHGKDTTPDYQAMGKIAQEINNKYPMLGYVSISNIPVTELLNYVDLVEKCG